MMWNMPADLILFTIEVVAIYVFSSVTYGTNCWNGKRTGSRFPCNTWGPKERNVTA